MNVLLQTLLCLHVVALHTSIAGMEIISGAIAAAAIVTGWQKGWRPRPIDKQILWLLLAFVVWVGVSLAVNPPVKPFWFQFGFMRWTLLLIALTVALETVWSEVFERRLLRTWTTLTLVTGAYAILQCATGLDFIRHDAVFPQGGGIYKAVGFFSISLTYAYVYGVMLFGVFQPAMRFGRRMTLALVFVGAGGILASMSRGAWLAALACVFVYLFAKHKRLLLPALVAVGVVIGGLVVQGGGFATKIVGMAQLKMDNSSSTRVDLWRAYSQMFLDHPTFGVGIFAGDKYLPAYFEKLGIVQPFTSHAHNNLLQFLAGTGVIGLLLYLAVCGWFSIRAWNLRSYTHWGWSLVLAQVFVQLGGLTECNFIDGEVTHASIFCWAITWVLDRRRSA